MRTTPLIVATIVILAYACAASGQTNTNSAAQYPKPVVAQQNPGVVLLANIESERGRLEIRGGAITRKLEEDRRLLSLRHQAKKVSGADYARQDTALVKQAAAARAPIVTRLAELNLKEYEVRKAYKLNAPEKPKKKR